MPDLWYARLLRPRLEEALGDSPVVLLHGPRQCGKTSLARQVGESRGYTYATFDDDTTRVAAETDPVGFVDALGERAILDEVQRVPRLLLALKKAVDEDRRPGRFLLTGSANVLVVPQLSDSLAGRMEVLRLHPLSQHEIERVEGRTLLDRLFGGEPPSGFRGERLREELAERIARGGYPAALTRPSARRRAAWYAAYADALVQRDVRDLSRVQSLDTLRRLLEAAAGSTASLLNLADLSGPLSANRQTIQNYVTLLRHVFVLDLLRAWHANRLKRLVKTAKLHVGDTGLGAALLGASAGDLEVDRELLGPMLETFVYGELVRQASGSEEPSRFAHYRDRDGVEVDVVVERGRRVVGVEVKAAASVQARDFRGLRKLGDVLGERLRAGVVFYDGEAALPFGERMWALPLRTLWSGAASGS